ncbi:MAG TPA: PIG-L family deacetylase, partial [Thermoanaerobaculia bacterium]|nr:PIG-L family deacetylase [Thermoanaerobaculia bacterium]
VIGAHPDDEDTSLLALAARELGSEAAYFSLTRGEGGQNLIGPELGVGLGLIRTHELLAARRIDGGRQYFSRAYDFGFTRSRDEALRLWSKDALLEDAVRVIRRFKPQVVVSVFPGVPSPTHGQHQTAGLIAHEAFPLAGNPSAMPGLTKEGLAPWTPQALYRSLWSSKTEGIPLSLGIVDPLTGKSMEQLAAASRSMHRSQDMGLLQPLGPDETRVLWVAGGPGEGSKGLFDGIDTRLTAIAATLPDPERRRHVGEHLDAAEAAAQKARQALHPSRLADAVPGFLEALKHLRAARAFLLEKGERPEERPTVELIAEKIDVAEIGLAAAAGIALDASTDREMLIAGEALPVRALLWNSGAQPVAGAAVELIAAEEWGSLKPATGESTDLAAGALQTWTLRAEVPAAAPPTAAYFLRRPLGDNQYDWTGVPAAVKGEPFGPPPLTARFSFTLDGVPVVMEREVVQIYRDQATGEVRRPLRVVPRVEVAAAEELLVWPAAGREPRRLQVTLDSHATTPVQGRLEAKVEGGNGTGAWPQVRSAAFRLEPGEEKTLELEVHPPAQLAPGRYALRLAAVLEDGERSELATPVLDYPHILRTPRPVPAEVRITAADIRLPELKRVGYVRGASDRVPEFLRQIGVPLDLLGPRDLLEGDLRRFDAIVVGSRAYETDPALGKANPRLLEYVQGGGLMIVQYQQYAYTQGSFPPLPLTFGQPNDRVTDEAAAVTLLDPAHPAFHQPNEIRAEDWNGWVQERGLYYARTWDPAYTPLLSMKDPDPTDTEQKGGLLVAKVGQGTYVYTGLAFFRQLPAGVPGAYRLFANLLGL